MDELAAHLTAAQAHHAALISIGSDREIRTAYIAALEAEIALLTDCGGRADLAAARDLGFIVDDERAAMAVCQ